MRNDDRELLSSISEQPKGKTLQEIHLETGMDIRDVECAIQSLRSKGYGITALYLPNRTIRRVYLSSYTTRAMTP